jgi:AAA domain
MSDLVCVADVAPEPGRWLWPGRIPLGKLTVLDGDPGMGKSTVTLTIMAKVTTGSPFPDGARPELADVILLSAEDDIGDTIRPRLEAAGADVNRVFVLPDVQEEDKPPRPPELPLDLDRLEAMIKERAAALVVVDPIAAFLSGAIDMHRDQDVRRALAPIAYMAARTGAAVLIVRHMNKSGGANPLYRGGGSIGIVGAARSGLLAAPDPDDEGRRILAVTKSNLAKEPAALAYRLVEDPRHEVVRVIWDGTTEHTAADLLVVAPHARPAPKQEAGAFLCRVLASEARPVVWLQKAAKDKGISWDTIKRAKEGLPIIVFRFRKGEEGRRGGGSWVVAPRPRPAPD